MAVNRLPREMPFEREVDEDVAHFPSCFFSRISSRAVQQPLLYHPLLRDAAQRVGHLFSVFVSFPSSSPSLTMDCTPAVWTVPVSIPDEVVWRRFFLLLAAAPLSLPSSSSSSSAFAIPSPSAGVVVQVVPLPIRYSWKAAWDGRRRSRWSTSRKAEAEDEIDHESAADTIDPPRRRAAPPGVASRVAPRRRREEGKEATDAMPSECTGEKREEKEQKGRATIPPFRSSPLPTPPPPLLSLLVPSAIQEDGGRMANRISEAALDRNENEEVEGEKEEAKKGNAVGPVGEEWSSVGLIMPLYHFLQCLAERDAEAGGGKGKSEGCLATEEEHERKRWRHTSPLVAREKDGTNVMTRAEVQLALSSIPPLLGEMLQGMEALQAEGNRYAPVGRFVASPPATATPASPAHGTILPPRPRPPPPASMRLSSDSHAGTDIYAPASFALLPHAPRVHALKSMIEGMYAHFQWMWAMGSPTAPLPLDSRSALHPPMARPFSSSVAASTAVWARPMRNVPLPPSFAPLPLQAEEEKEARRKEGETAPVEVHAGNGTAAPLRQAEEKQREDATEEREGGGRAAIAAMPLSPPSTSHSTPCCPSLLSTSETPIASLLAGLWKSRGRARALVRSVMEEKRCSMDQERVLRRAGTLIPFQEEEWESRGEEEGEWEGRRRRREDCPPNHTQVLWRSVGGAWSGGYEAVLDAGGATRARGIRRATESASLLRDGIEERVPPLPPSQQGLSLR